MITVAPADKYFWRGPVWQGEEVLRQPLHWKKPSTVFVGSRTDMFHDQIINGDELDRVMDVIAQCPQHEFLILTKRAANMRGYFAQRAAPDNLGAGLSLCNQPEADEKLGHLWQTSAAWKFLSVEPMLGPVIFRAWKCACGWTGAESLLRPSPSSSLVCPTCGGSSGLLWNNLLDGIGLVIVGGESGKKARPMHPDWPRRVRDDCQAAGVPFFFKAWGEWAPLYTEIPLEDAAKCSVRPGNVIAWKASDYGEAVSLRYAREHSDLMAYSVRVGKKLAGRVLDGWEWNELPEQSTRK